MENKEYMHLHTMIEKTNLKEVFNTLFNWLNEINITEENKFLVTPSINNKKLEIKLME